MNCKDFFKFEEKEEILKIMSEINDLCIFCARYFCTDVQLIAELTEMSFKKNG